MNLTDEMIEQFVEIFARHGVPADGPAGMTELGWTVRFRTDAKEYEAWVSLKDLPVVEVAQRFVLFKWLWPLFNAPFILGHNLFLAYRALVGPRMFELLNREGRISDDSLSVEELLPDEDLPAEKRKEIDDEIIRGVLAGRIKPAEDDQADLEERAVSLLSEALGEEFEALPSDPDEIRRVGLALVRRMFSYMPEENLEALMIDLGLYEPESGEEP